VLVSSCLRTVSGCAGHVRQQSKQYPHPFIRKKAPVPQELSRDPEFMNAASERREHSSEREVNTRPGPSLAATRSFGGRTLYCSQINAVIGIRRIASASWIPHSPLLSLCSLRLLALSFPGPGFSLSSQSPQHPSGSPLPLRLLSYGKHLISFCFSDSSP
jgi:hypothetical protein